MEGYQTHWVPGVLHTTGMSADLGYNGQDTKTPKSIICSHLTFVCVETRTLSALRAQDKSGPSYFVAESRELVAFRIARTSDFLLCHLYRHVTLGIAQHMMFQW